MSINVPNLLLGIILILLAVVYFSWATISPVLLGVLVLADGILFVAQSIGAHSGSFAVPTRRTPQE